MIRYLAKYISNEVEKLQTLKRDIYYYFQVIEIYKK